LTGPLYLALGLVSIPARNAILGLVERPLIMDERLLWVDLRVISKALPEREPVRGGPTPGKRHNNFILVC
jgi:hypothetical protein